MSSHLCPSMFIPKQAQTFLFWTFITPTHLERCVVSLRGVCVAGNLSLLERVRTWGWKWHTCPLGMCGRVCTWIFVHETMFCVRVYCTCHPSPSDCMFNFLRLLCRTLITRDEAAITGAHSSGQWWGAEVEPDGGAGPGDKMLRLPQNRQGAQEGKRGLRVPQNLRKLPPQWSLWDKVRCWQQCWLFLELNVRKLKCSLFMLWNLIQSNIAFSYTHNKLKV